MRNYTFTLFLGLVLGVGACGGPLVLSEAGRKVKLMKADPPENCDDVGSVSGFAIGPNFQDDIKTKLKNSAAEKGGNYVRLETVDRNGNNLAGTAFRCPEAPPAAAQAPATASAPPPTQSM